MYEATKIQRGDCDSLATRERTKTNEVDPTTLIDKHDEHCVRPAAGEVAATALDNPDEQPSPEEILQMPNKGSKAVLRIGKEWVTAKERRHLYNAKRGPKIWAYIKRRRKWSDEQYDSVT
eukprot:scaffold2027_cov148-Skeletonema_marinoi.AAC.14